MSTPLSQKGPHQIVFFLVGTLALCFLTAQRNVGFEELIQVIGSQQD